MPRWARILLIVVIGIYLLSEPIVWEGPFEGRVTDAKTGRPIANAVVAAFWTGRFPGPGHDGVFTYDAQEAATDADGRYRLPGLRRINPIPFTRIDEPSFIIYAAGYAGCDMLALDTAGGCGQPDVRLTPLAELPAEERARSSKPYPSSRFDDKVPMLLQRLHADGPRDPGANTSHERGGSPPWSASPSSPSSPSS
jgi:hypothetical protein